MVVLCRWAVQCLIGVELTTCHGFRFVQNVCGPMFVDWGGRRSLEGAARAAPQRPSMRVFWACCPCIVPKIYMSLLYIQFSRFAHTSLDVEHLKSGASWKVNCVCRVVIEPAMWHHLVLFVCAFIVHTLSLHCTKNMSHYCTSNSVVLLTLSWTWNIWS